MYSKVKLLGHPIHPMLVVFPVAFYTSTLVTFIIYAGTENVFWFRVATICNWAGVGTAVVAAIPGFIDWVSGIPSGSHAKRHGRLHMVLNLLALSAFIVSAAVSTAQWNEALPGAAWAIVFSAIGLGLTLPAGFLGWTLVQTHHVGVELTPEQERLETGAVKAGPPVRRHTGTAE